MTGMFYLDWATMSMSLLNTVLLLWLGVTVLLNAERRSWGVWSAGIGLLMGSAFFVSHSAMLGQDLHYATRGMEFWWLIGWVPVLALPLAWYVVMLWYAGYWSSPRTPLYRRHLAWAALCSLMALAIVLLFAIGSPLPSYGQVAQLDWSGTPSIARVPLLADRAVDEPPLLDRALGAAPANPIYIVLAVFAILVVLLLVRRRQESEMRTRLARAGRRRR